MWWMAWRATVHYLKYVVDDVWTFKIETLNLLNPSTFVDRETPRILLSQMAISVFRTRVPCQRRKMQCRAPRASPLHRVCQYTHDVATRAGNTRALTISRANEGQSPGYYRFNIPFYDI